MAGALVTGIYAFRMIFLVFHGPPSEFASEHAPAHTAHGEGPFSMMWTITALAIGTVAIGVLQVPGITDGMQTFLEFAAPTFVEPTRGQEEIVATLSPLLGVAGIVIAYALWGGRERSDAPARAARVMAPLPRVFEEKFGFDIAYDWVFYKPAAGLARLGVRFWEGPVVARRRRCRRGLALDHQPALAGAVGDRAHLRGDLRVRAGGTHRLLPGEGRGLMDQSVLATLIWLWPLVAAAIVGLIPWSPGRRLAGHDLRAGRAAAGGDRLGALRRRPRRAVRPDPHLVRTSASATTSASTGCRWCWSR